MKEAKSKPGAYHCHYKDMGKRIMLSHDKGKSFSIMTKEEFLEKYEPIKARKKKPKVEEISSDSEAKKKE